MDAIGMLSVESLNEKSRITSEIPSRVAVHGVIMLMKGCDNDYAGTIFQRLLNAGKVPKCEEVEYSMVVRKKMS